MSAFGEEPFRGARFVSENRKQLVKALTGCFLYLSISEQLVHLNDAHNDSANLEMPGPISSGFGLANATRTKPESDPQTLPGTVNEYCLR
jgi:hypothetical protein